MPPSNTISGLMGHLLLHVSDVELYGESEPISATGLYPLKAASVISISLEYAPTVMAFHACPGLSTQCNVFASG